MPSLRAVSIWWFAFGYFACYVPYSALTKALSDGLLPFDRVAGLSLLPVSTLASMLGMIAFLWSTGWIRDAGRRTVAGVSLPMPGRFTLLSGLCTALVIVTTTLAYTFGRDVSIVLMMLLMRGGVLVIAPLVDALTGRHVRWFSWVALALSLASLLVTFRSTEGLALTVWAVIDVCVYLAAYFVRLRLMSRLAKAADPALSRRYFVEEQLVASPAVVFAIAVLALVGPDAVAGPLRTGFTALGAPEVWALTALVGVLSQGTGIFGGLVLLDSRENTFCVPVNRASSMLAGLCATVALWLALGAPPPARAELIAAGLIIAAIGVLSAPTLLAARKQG